MTFFHVDVESIGLHGEAYALGYVVCNHAGAVLEEACWASPPELAHGSTKDRAWVAQNVPALTATHATPRALRHAFWQRWLHWKGQGAQMVVNCGWPVEARLLAACVDDVLQTDGDAARWQGPYPLHDLATAMHLRGFDPTQAQPRLPHELPLHNPLADARQAARLWHELMQQPSSPRSPT